MAGYTNSRFNVKDKKEKKNEAFQKAVKTRLKSLSNGDKNKENDRTKRRKQVGY